MKQRFLLTVILCSMLFVSCSDLSDIPEWGTYPDSSAFVKTKVVDNINDSSQKEYYFVADNGLSIFLTDNQLETQYDFVDGERIVIYFSLLEDYSLDGAAEDGGMAYGCDYGMRLFEVHEVYVSESVTVTTQEESDAIADDPIPYIYSSVTCTDSYINMVMGLDSNSLDDIQFYLVENLSMDPDTTKKGYTNLELRYDRGTETASTTYSDKYVSLPLASFASILKDQTGVLLRFVNLSSGEVSVALDFEEEEED